MIIYQAFIFLLFVLFLTNKINVEFQNEFQQRVVSFLSETPMQKTKLSFASNYQPEIVSEEMMKTCVCPHV